MAKARKLERRRKSVQNIRKITRTMELVATTRFKRAMDRAVAARAYTERITALVGHLARAGLEVSHPLLDARPETVRATLLVLTSNRGLCAGYNASVLRLATTRWRELTDGVPESGVPESRIEISGKRGIGSLRFRGVEPNESFTHFEDRPTFEEVELLADRYLEAYETGRLDRLDVAYTRFESLGRQQAVVETLLPLGSLDGMEDEKEAFAEEPAGLQYDLLPSAESILEEVVPLSFKVKLFKCFLDAAVSEQVARMVAMKSATENADGMIRHLTSAYNQARQGQITSELLEIIGGAEALSK